MTGIRDKIAAHPYRTLLVLSLGLRVAALASSLPGLEAGLNKDALLYDILARNIASGLCFSLDGHATAIVPPLYPYLLAGLLGLPGGGVEWMAFLQVILSACTVLYVFALGSLVTDRRTAWIAGLVAALYWPFAAAAVRILSETLFIFLLVAGAFHLTALSKRDSQRDALMAGLWLGLACLTRGVGLYYAGLCGVWFLYRAWRGRSRTATLAAGVYIVVFAAVMSPWVIRNAREFGEMLPGGSNNGMVLYTGNFPAEGYKFGLNLRPGQLLPEQRYILDLPELERDHALKSLAVHRILREPGRVAATVVRKALFFWAPVDWEILGHGEGVFNPWYFWVLLAGLAWLFLSDDRSKMWLPLSIPAYFFLISLVAYGSPRLRLPVEPFLILCAAGGWVIFEGRVRSGEWRAAALAAIVLSGGVSYVYGYQIKGLVAALFRAAGLW